jgi:hypothetical protein
MPPAEQNIRGQRQHPVTHLVADDPPRRPRDFRKKPRVPPHVVRIHHHADRLGGEQKRQVHRLAQRSDHAPVGAEHRVQRLDPEPNPKPLRNRHQLADRVRNHTPGQPEIPAARHQPAAHQDQRIRLQRGRLPHRRHVVRPHGLPPVGVARRDRGEEAASAQARHAQPGAPDQSRR